MSPSRERLTDDEVASLVRAAAGGDEAAWDALVRRFGALVWSIARAHRLTDADAADVSQTTWLRLVEHLDRLRHPGRVGPWLAATARNECLRVLRLRGRQVLAGEEFELVDEVTPPPGAALFLAERDEALWRAFDALPSRCRALLRVIVATPPPTYEELAAALDIPIGSIGPTRARCLERLRRHPDIVRVFVGLDES